MASSSGTSSRSTAASSSSTLSWVTCLNITRVRPGNWISAAEGKKFQQVIAEITEQTRQMGPYRAYPAART